MKPLAQKPTKQILSARNTPQTFTLNKLAKPIVRDDIFSLPPAVYGTIYLTLIPLFGFLYSTLPNMQFNHEDVGFLEAMYFIVKTELYQATFNTILKRIKLA